MSATGRDDGSSTAGWALIDRLAQEFTARVRAGEPVEIEAFASRHPELADAIRRLFPSILRLEQAAHERPGAPSTAMPQRVGDYLLLHELGRGGMGVVHLAEHVGLGRRVALKLLPLHDKGSAAFQERFQREARAAARLDHPHIVPVHGAGQDGDVSWLAMHYVDGLGLDRILRRLQEVAGGRDSGAEDRTATQLARRLVESEVAGPARPETASAGAEEAGEQHAPLGATYFRNVARLGLQAADALAYAHSHGVLHRDVKPSNLLLDLHGSLWVTDFGLCKTSDGDDLTLSGDLVGTLRYMAPEQAQGEADVRSDVYGLGATLYQLVTLHPPFEGDTRAGLLHAVLYRQPVRPRRLAPDIPPDLEAIVLRAMAKLPEERYGTARALAEDLGRFLAGRPVAARSPGVLHLLRLTARRNRTATAVAAVAALVLVGATLLYVLGLQRARRQEQRRLYSAQVVAAAAAIERRDMTSARRLLEVAPEGLRGFEWELFVAMLDQSRRRVVESSAPIRALLYDRHGQRVVTAEETAVIARPRDDPQGAELLVLARGTVECLLEVPTTSDLVLATSLGEVLRLRGGAADPDPDRVELNAHVEGMSASGDGRCIAVALESGRLVLMDSRSWTVQRAVALDQGPLLCAAFVLDGTAIAVGSRNGQLSLVDPDDGSVRRIAATGASLDCSAASPDGRLLAVGSRDDLVRVWDLREGRLLHSLAGHTAGVEGVAFDPTGRVIASVSFDRSVRLWDTQRGECLRTLLGHSRGLRAATFTPEGALLTASWEGTVLEWDPWRPVGRVRVPLHLRDLTRIALSPDGERVATVSNDGSLRLLEADTLRELRLVPLHQFRLEEVRFSPDGSSLLVTGVPGQLTLIDASEGSELWSTPTLAWGTHCAVFTPDGGRVLAGTLEGTLVVVDARDGEVLSSEPVFEQALSALAISRNGSLLALGSDGGDVLVRDLDGRGERIRERPHDDRVSGLAFDAEAELLVSSSYDGRLAFWDPRRGRLLERMEVESARHAAHTDALERLSFHPDGSRLAIASHAGVVHLWDPHTREAIVSLQGDGSQYWFQDVAFSPDGARLYGAFRDLWVWSAEPTPADAEGTLSALLPPHDAVRVLHDHLRTELRREGISTGELVAFRTIGLELAWATRFDDERVLSAVASFDLLRGRPAEALNWLHLAEGTARAHGRPAALETESLLALVYLRLGDGAQADVHLRRARAVADDTADASGRRWRTLAEEAFAAAGAR